VAELRHSFSKNGGTLGEAGSVNWMFEKKGVIKAQAGSMSEEDILEKLLDYPVDDVIVDEGTIYVQCSVRALDEIRQSVAALGLKVESAEIEWVPKNTMDFEGDSAQKAFDFMEAIEDLDDVQNVYSNIA
jgi:transcriptional/translational regulatory protein YebC/TACO1